ncbi:hypothetical protein [Ancylobacter terrae]|uniref:hypothetical protein n=1 Tax=Ancylobacter sp. sgz301288 TaxID=3342077 RepID=UPI003859B0E7
MDFVQINDRDGRCLSVDLRHILRVLGHRAEQLWWAVGPIHGEYFEAMGEGQAELKQLEVSGRRLAGPAFGALAERVHQVIWGDFAGFATEDAETPELIICAIDSSYYEVHAVDDAILDRMRQSFADVTDGDSRQLMFDDQPWRR